MLLSLPQLFYSFLLLPFLLCKDLISECILLSSHILSFLILHSLLILQWLVHLLLDNLLEHPLLLFFKLGCMPILFIQVNKHLLVHDYTLVFVYLLLVFMYMDLVVKFILIFHLSQPLSSLFILFILFFYLILMF